MQGRYLVPKNILFYLCYFLAAAGGWMGTLWLYYHLNDFSEWAGVETLPFLDLNQTGSLNQWFISLIWLIIAVHSFMMIFFVISRSRRERYEEWIREAKGVERGRFPKYNGLIKVLFWFAVCGIAIMMSAETICRVSPFIFRRIHDLCRALVKGDSDVSIFYLGFMTLALAFVFVTAGCLRQYINSVRKSQWILYPSFFLTSLALGLSILFPCLIPDPNGLTGEERARAALTRIPEKVHSENEGDDSPAADSDFSGKSTEKDAESEDSPEALGGKNRKNGMLGRVLKKEKTDAKSDDGEKKKKKEEKDYLLVSYEKPADNGDQNVSESEFRNVAAEEEVDESERTADPSSPVAAGMTWEEILGWDQTIEARLKLKKPFEEYLRMKEPSEDYVLTKFPSLDLIQIRTLLRQGFYGLFLVFLSTGLGFLARAERLVFDKKLSRPAGWNRNPYYEERRGLWGRRDSSSDRYLD